MTGRKGEKGEPGARGTRVRHSHCVHGEMLQFTIPHFYALHILGLEKEIEGLLRPYLA